MTDASVGPTAAELFRKWKEFLDGGSLPTTSLVASARPELADPLQRLIDDYMAGRVTAPEPTTDGPDGSPAPDGPPAIAGYTFLQCLGRGGMGEVYRVRDRLDREHALKVARRKQLSPAGRERFLAEAKAMDRLNHPHVAKVHHYDEKDGRPYFLMALYPANLSDRLADYCADVRAGVRLMAAVADGVGHLHSHGFVHRDLKPSNILIDKAGRPVVSDFGLIKGLADGDSSTDPSSGHASGETNATGARRSHTVAGLILGTRRYMAPDQAAGLNHQAGPAWDVWALGVMLHELLTGQPPRSSIAPERLLDPGEPDNPSPTTIRPDLDPRLAKIVEKCLARDPADRYPTGAAVAADLSRWLHRGRRRWLTAASVLLLALMAGMVAVAVTRPRPRPRTAEQVLADIQQELRDGRGVEVIGSTGMPKWFNVATSGGDRPYASEVDGTLRVSTEEVALIDMPPTGCDRYRFEAEVRQLTLVPVGYFGIYAGRHRLPTTTGQPADCFALVWFNDHVEHRDRPGPAGPWVLSLRYNLWVPGAGSVSGGRQLPGAPYPETDGPGPAGWHKLAVEVRPDLMAWSFDGRPAGSVILPLVAELERSFGEAVKLPLGVRTDFSPAGGYGLVVSRGAAAFRNAHVGPVGP